jgi:hypothetical protein
VASFWGVYNKAGLVLRVRQFLLAATSSILSNMLDILPNDTHYFGITAICTVALNLLAFAISYTCQFDKVRHTHKTA